jgi:hypothetical protein
MTREREHTTARAKHQDGLGDEVKEGAKTVGRGILWLVIAVAVVAVVVGVFLLGPLGLGIVVPAVLAIWIAAAAASGGPAIGA